MFIENADHGFGGVVDAAPRKKDHRVRKLLVDEDQQAYVKATTLAFLDAHVRGLLEAKGALATGRIDKFTDGSCKVTEK